MIDFKKLRDPAERERIAEAQRQREAEIEAREAQRAQLLDALEDYREQMTLWERSFLNSLISRHTLGLPPTDAQARVLRQLQERYIVPAADAAVSPSPD